MSDLAFQEYYSDDTAHCYGCGRLNDHGLQLKSYWEGEISVARYTPRPYHIAIPGFVYGGLLASLIDCHATGTAAAAAYRAQGRDMGTEPPLRYVTGSLHVNYLKPTPLGIQLELRGEVVELTDRKVIVEIDLFAGDQLTVRGEVVAVKMPEDLIS
jgi:acyl-coenzyme A thioesterase PaaI-like protein